MNYEILDNQNIIRDLSYKIGKSVGWLVSSRKKNYGVMISHPNFDSDYNGIKVFSTKLERFPIDEKCILRHLISSNLFSFDEDNLKKYVIIGSDNRNSSEEIKKKIIKGIHFINKEIKIIDFGISTTPLISFSLIHKSFCEDLYYEKFFKLNGMELNYNDLIVDCAYGAAGLMLKKILTMFRFNITLINSNETNWQKINFRCGVTHILKYNKFPLNWNNYTYGCSLNSDASQVIFYYFRDKFNLLDGDYISALYMTFVRSLNLDKNLKINFLHKFNTNRNVLNYIEKLGFDTVIIKDENNFIDKESHFSIFFNSNGKGKVYSNNINEINNKKLLDFISLVNSITSDGITNIFGVLFCLSFLKIGFVEWHNFFRKIKSVTYKKEIENIGRFVTDEKGKLIYPKGFQRNINELMLFYDSYCIIKPMKDHVMIYIECEKYLNVMKDKVNNLLKQFDNYLNK